MRSDEGLCSGEQGALEGDPAHLFREFALAGLRIHRNEPTRLPGRERSGVVERAVGDEGGGAHRPERDQARIARNAPLFGRTVVFPKQLSALGIESIEEPVV